MVDRIAWSDDLLTHVDVIDADHRKLFVLANGIFASVSLGSDAVDSAMGELWNYTKVHFGREEDSMRQTEYPRRTAHKKEHEDLLARFDYLTERLAASGPEAIGDDVIRFMEEWLKDHIMSFDKQYADYLRASGSAG